MKFSFRFQLEKPKLAVSNLRQRRYCWIFSVTSHIFALKTLQGAKAEAVRRLLLHLADLAAASVVPQGARHLLVGRGLAVALVKSPQLGQLLLAVGEVPVTRAKSADTAGPSVVPAAGSGTAGPSSKLQGGSHTSRSQNNTSAIHTVSEQKPVA